MISAQVRVNDEIVSLVSEPYRTEAEIWEEVQRVLSSLLSAHTGQMRLSGYMGLNGPKVEVIVDFLNREGW